MNQNQTGMITVIELLAMGLQFLCLAYVVHSAYKHRKKLASIYIPANQREELMLKEIAALRRNEVAYQELMQYMNENIGEANDEWPIHLRVDSIKTGTRLSFLINRANAAAGIKKS
jgi:hypothetical protein